MSHVRTRDPQTKQQQLLEAALTEFAEFGMAGARVERLARRAGISPGLVYSFYKGKGELFDAVFDHIVELVVSAVPIDADHLPEYAERLYDAALERPDVLRFVTWYRLERGDGAQRAVLVEALREKVNAIAGAQSRGTVTSVMPAAQVLALTLAVANMWNQPGEDTQSLVPESQRRQAVRDAVSRLVMP